MTQTDPLNDDWPLRSWVLAGLGGLCGLAIHALATRGVPEVPTNDPARLALAAFCAVGGLAFAYTLERLRVVSSAVFAIIAALVMAFVVYWNGAPNTNDGEPWRMVCAALTVAIAAPLFMAWRDGPGGRQIPYVGAHNRAWTSVVLWFASWAFVGIVWLLSFLIAALFDLIGIHFLNELLKKGWFGMTMTGAALGGAIGVLRDREQILGTLQRVVTTVLSVLAPVLGAGLMTFLIVLPFTGLAPLWEATKSTTPILIGCVIGALILANAVIGDTLEDEAKHPVLRISAMALGFAMLPLGAIAAISTGLRVRQYGLTPDRLWAVVFTGIACAYGLVYLVSIARKRLDWSTLVRPGNMRMAVSVCAIAFVLAMPLISFGALSAHDQVARLMDGRTPASKFDWAALRFDFGPSGKVAAEALAKSGKTAEIRTAAATVLKANNRYAAREVVDAVTLDQRVIILPHRVVLPEGLRTELSNSGGCSGSETCVLLYAQGASEGVVTNGRWSEVFTLSEGKWQHRYSSSLSAAVTASDAELKAGPVAIRDIKRRQVFVGNKPVGEAFE